jgi:poly(U)-specific endoribonuclease
VPFCSGFEHIVVGESKGNPNDKGIGGYHSWTKYLFDQESGRVNFNGFNYDNKFNRLSPQGSSVPYVATVSLTYEPLDMDGQPMGKKRKNLGGFFVGLSPESQIAMPVVAYYESINNLFFVGSGNTAREKTEKEVEIHDAVYRLVLYMETRQDQTRGDRLRSFYPKFIRLKSGSSITPDPGDTQGIIAVVAMLANPAGPEKGNEWVEIENRSDEIINLDGFKLVDHKNRLEPLTLNIEPRQRLRIMVSRSTPNSMQLTNSGGTVSVIDAAGGLVTKVTYPKSDNGETLFFV